eukprot:3196764-Prymnesium_polylepis.1
MLTWIECLQLCTDTAGCIVAVWTRGRTSGSSRSCSITPRDGEARQYPFGDDSQGLARCLLFDSTIRSPETTVKDALGCEFLTYRLAVRNIAFP